MQAIKTITELETLKRAIDDVYDKVDRFKKQLPSFSLASAESRENTKILEASGLPLKINLAPELASFLVQDHDVHELKSEAIGTSSGRIGHALKMAGRISIAAFHPSPLVNAAKIVYHEPIPLIR